MIRLVRAKFVLLTIISLLALAAAATLSAPLAGATPAHLSKKAKKGKAKTKAKKKHAANKGSEKVASVTVTGGSETLTFSSAAVQTLERDKVTTTIASPATGALASGIVFSISGGTLNPSTGLGSVTSAGGVMFSASFSVPGVFSSESNSTASEPSVALNSAPTLSFTSANVSPPTFPFATVSLKGVKPTSGAGTLTLSNAALALTETGASLLDKFASNAFTTGEAIGTLTIQATVSR